MSLCRHHVTNRAITVLGFLVAMIVVSAPGRAATIFVDDDAPSDPGPNNNTVSDPLEDGTPAHPFDKIQEGIAAAATGLDDVEVAPGTYDEAIDFIGKAITVYSTGVEKTN